MRSILRELLISMACIRLWSSADRVHDSQAYGRKDVTRFSHTLELKEILLSFQTGFSHGNAPVVCAVQESISGLEPSSVITEPRYLKHVTGSSFYPFTSICVLMPLVLFVISLVFSAMWGLCRDAQLILPVLLPLLLSYRCHQQIRDW